MLPSPPGRKGLSCPMEQFFMERKRLCCPHEKGIKFPLGTNSQRFDQNYRG